jgi:hypothetical protein
MPWTCFKVKSMRMTDWQPSETGGQSRWMLYTLPDGREVEFKDLPPGAMWHSSEQPVDSFYAKCNSIMVVLPGKTIWPMNEVTREGARWEVSGEIPNVTSSPSINYVGIYHGWVQNGVVTDDCEGRKFDALGNKLP